MNLTKHPSAEAAPGLLFAAFNQDATCFGAGTDNGFRVYHSQPLKEKTRREYGAKSSAPPSSSSDTVVGAGDGTVKGRPELNVPGGIALVEMMYRTNYIALVGGGRNPKFPPNKVFIWDDLKQAVVIELEFRSEVKAVRLRRERIVVALANKVFVYTFAATPQRLHVFETFENERGLIALSPWPFPAISSPGSGAATLAFPGRTHGQIQVLDLMIGSVVVRGGGDGDSLGSGRSNTSSAKSGNVPVVTPAISIIAAHTSPLSCLVTSYNGHLLASSSDKGTLIRVFDARTGRIVNELRRGVDKAAIYSIAFNIEGTRVCVASDKGTVHVFNLATAMAPGSGGGTGPGSTVVSQGTSLQYTPSSRHLQNASSRTQNPTGSGGAMDRNDLSPSGNRQSSLSFLSPYLPKYFSSEWSFAQFTVPSEPRCICAFALTTEPLANARPTSQQPSSLHVKQSATQQQGPTPVLRSTNTIIAVCADGSFYRFSFDGVRGGDGTRDAFHRFYRGPDDYEAMTGGSGADGGGGASAFEGGGPGLSGSGVGSQRRSEYADVRPTVPRAPSPDLLEYNSSDGEDILGYSHQGGRLSDWEEDDDL